MRSANDGARGDTGPCLEYAGKMGCSNPVMLAQEWMRE